MVKNYSKCESGMGLFTKCCNMNRFSELRTNRYGIQNSMLLLLLAIKKRVD